MKILNASFVLYTVQVYVAEADGIPEYGASVSLGQRLVAVKFLLQNANEKEK